ncbi:TIGR01906 family membrane protein [Lactobacillus sp. ESL0684]|uniref:TIGR01906 family membrane protein n=1 Tax=unclassified Lactobacillus TaxID=2620435 RepID=UPI0023F6D13C|nr:MULTISPECIES: TIGR01906 family membrane protein [unclassified Lactobacillus]WEV40196.1 TIGR01906 family membrane protein [Lactobacillus sp. ESL0681]WEV43282.1 TIGR01906 family membrane protein [Lactobacillus sp. ESL0684]
MSTKNSIFTLIYHFIFAITSSVVGALIASWPLLIVFVLVQKTSQTVNLTLGQIMHNYNQLLWYLIWPLQTKLAMTDFPTSPLAAEHFAEVKRLFILAIVAFLCCLVIYLLHKKNKNNKALKLNKVWALLFLLLPIALLPFALTNFDSFFIAFHHLFFAGSNTWLFDPATDPIINVLTEGFFASCFAVAGIIYELYFAQKLLGQ